MELSRSPEHVIDGIEGFQPQTGVDLLLGFQNKMDGMNTVVIDLPWDEAANVLLSHNPASLSGML
jgi:hypothetical protein